ncbi:MAG: aryl-sulfate sulfotransferase [Candidatus Thermoplasmatota archaeon]|nr:aryl-sulfate sulfotransferase [Candidatus Thermoplasmatota archaeon]
MRRTLHEKSRLVMVFLSCLLIAPAIAPVSVSQLTSESIAPTLLPEDGQFLYSPMWTTTTYLRHSDGSLNHSWTSSFFPGAAVWWLGDGTILRTIRVGAGPGSGGAGGGVQKVEWDGTLTWDFRYNTNGVLSHHDGKSLPNGNVLLIAWETKTRSEAIAAGRNPNYVTNYGFWPDHVIEVQPTGPTSGDIVWEWHAWDHLIQDYDPSKPNYGVVGDHPELVDLNYVTSSQADWLHTNSIDYNEEFDQILLSAHNFNEVWVIDHSTTTLQAAGHTGGNSGKGGDLLYRWGNPQAYDRGTSSNKKLFGQHDATWIDPGLPGEGNILVFNNGVGRGYSTVDEFIPPVDENGMYYLAAGAAYGPETQTWIYSPQPTFYASHLSGAQRLPTGNTMITNGETGKIFEVTPAGTTVWQYNTGGQVFKTVYIPPEEEPPEPNTPNLECFGSLSWTNVEPGATVIGSFQVQNIGAVNSTLNWTIDTYTITWGTWTFTPESGINLRPADGPLTVQVSVIAPEEENTEFEGFIRVSNQEDASDYEDIPVYLKTPLDSEVIHFPILHQLLLKLRQWRVFITSDENHL